MKRDVQLDAVRGFCLVLMTNAHIGGPISKLTLEFAGFTGAAEYFIFLSGLVAGIVYTKRADRTSLPQLNSMAFGRTWTIYKYHVAIYMLLLLFAVLFPVLAQPLKDARYATIFFGHPGLAVLLGSTFLYQPTFMNILPVYCFFVAATPFAIHQFAIGKAKRWFTVSVLLWFSCQLGFNQWLVDISIGRLFEPRFSSLSLLAWQFVYFLGLWLGFKRYRGEKVFSPLNYRRWLWLSAAVAAVLFLLRHGIRGIKRLQRLGSSLLDDYASLVPSPEFISHIDDLTFKTNIAPLRLLNFLVVVVLVGFLLERYQPLLRAKWLIFIGKHSLQVWAYHVVVVYAVFLLEKNLLPAGTLTTDITISVLALAAIASLTLPAMLHQRSLDRRRRALEAPPADASSTESPRENP